MDLLVVQLKAAIRRLLDSKGVRARVLDKVNRYGEVVIGVILEKPTPPKLDHTASRDENASQPRDENASQPRARPSGAEEASEPYSCTAQRADEGSAQVSRADAMRLSGADEEADR